MGKKGDLSDFECGMVVGLSISQTADLLGFPSLGFTENGPKKRKYPVSENENALLRSEENGLVRDDRKTTVTQITNQGLQNTSLNTQHVEP